MIKAATSRVSSMRGASTLGSALVLPYAAPRGRCEPSSGSMGVVWPRVGGPVVGSDIDDRFSIEFLESVCAPLIGDLVDALPLIVNWRV